MSDKENAAIGDESEVEETVFEADEIDSDGPADDDGQIEGESV